MFNLCIDFKKMFSSLNSSGRRKKKSIDVINDNDDAIAKVKMEYCWSDIP